MKKRLLSACAAILCLAQIPALSASAVSIDEAAWTKWTHFSYTEAQDGRAWCEDAYFMLEGFLVITDGTELTAEILQTLPTCEYFDWVLTELDFDPAAAVWNGEGMTAQENARYYQVYPRMSVDCAPVPVFVQCAKQLMLENPCITYAAEIECYADGYVQWNGVFLPLLAGGDILPEMSERLAADEDYQAAMEYYALWQAGGVTDYTSLEYAEIMAQTLFEKFTDNCVIMQPEHTFIPERSTAVYSADDCWSDAGDYGGDGNVDASDASALLVYASRISAGTSQGIQDITDRMDMNADGQVNSKDAAVILQYASAAGTGYTGDIVDFVRQKQSMFT